MSDTLLCVLYICACGHPPDDHDYGPDGACTNIVEINDLGAVLCACTGFTDADAPCQCGHPESEHYPPPSGKGVLECWAVDDRERPCGCDLYVPATADTASGQDDADGR